MIESGDLVEVISTLSMKFEDRVDSERDRADGAVDAMRELDKLIADIYTLLPQQVDKAVTLLQQRYKGADLWPPVDDIRKRSYPRSEIAIAHEAGLREVCND